MPKYRILLVEELVLSDSGEFTVEAPTATAAAKILFDAHSHSRNECTDLVRLADGQEQNIEPDAVARTHVFCVLLDEAGNQIQEIQPTVPTPAATISPRQPTSPAPAETSRDPHWLYDEDEWECTYSWSDRHQLAEGLSLGEFRKFATLVNGPPTYAALIPVTFDDEGHPNETETQWFHWKHEAQTAFQLACNKSPNPDYHVPTHSPWGKTDGFHFIAPGILSVFTPSHGGLHLSPTLNAAMPDYMRSADAWYEEDCRWSLVALKYPTAFRAQIGLHPAHPSKNNYEIALDIARGWHPDIVERFFNVDAPADNAERTEPPANSVSASNDEIVVLTAKSE